MQKNITAYNSLKIENTVVNKINEVAFSVIFLLIFLTLLLAC